MIRAKAEATAIQTEYTGYAGAFKNLKDYIGFNDKNAWISMMFAEMISKLSNLTDLNIGFSTNGVLIDSSK